MAGPRPQSPGWYPDPDIHPGSRSFLRYWTGSHWTERRRPTPILTTLDLAGPIGAPQTRSLEGPARTAELPAPAAEVSATRDLGSRPDTGDRSGIADRHQDEIPTLASGGRGVPPEPPDPTGGGDGRGGAGDGGAGDAGASGGRAKTRKRRRWWLAAAVAVVAALAVALAGEAMRPASPGPRVLTDASFIKAANAECAKSLPALRPPDGGPFGSAVTPANAAKQIDTAASGLDDLANRLAALPAAAADQPHIAGWLDGWHRYDAIGHQYADFLRQHGATKNPPAMLKTGADLAKASDNFSRANGLGACLFAFAYNPDPSQF